MTKKILSVMIVLSMVLWIVGCGTTYQEAVGQTKSKPNDDFAYGYFTVIAEWSGYEIIYANDTKVKYLVKESGYQFGITPLYNADGSLQIYEESEEVNEKP